MSAGNALATVVDVTSLRVEAQVLEHHLPYVRAGGDASIATPALAGPLLVVAGDMVLVEGHVNLTHDPPVRVVNAAVRAQSLSGAPVHRRRCRGLLGGP